MTLPRRRSNAMPTVAGKDTTKSKVVIPEGTPVEVVEQKGDKTLVYTAEIKEDENQDQRQDTNDFDEDEDLPRFVNEPPAPVIPKSPLDKLFDQITYCVKQEGSYDSFIAKLLREPDQITDRFNTPCRDYIDVGAFSFSSQDRFRFYEAIQDANDNSGGRFAISIFTHDYNTLESQYSPSMANPTQWHHRQPLELPRPVIAQLIVMNPKAKPIIESNGGSENSIGAAILKLAELQSQQHNQLVQLLSRQPEKSEVETMLMAAMIQKFTHDLTNPPQANGVNGADALQQTMIAMFSAPAMAQKMIEKAFPEATPEREPTLIEQVKQVLEIPAVADASDRVFQVLETAAVKGLKLQETEPIGETQAAPNPQQQPQQAPPPPAISEDQMELLTTIVDELDSENPLDASNETIKELQADFPDQFADLTAMCQAAEFDGVFRILLGKAAKIQPFPFTAFLDVDLTQANINANKMTYPEPYVWNEQGLRLIERLKELHAYLKSTV